MCSRPARSPFWTAGTTLGVAFLDANGQTSFTTNALDLGGHSIQAFYPGDTNYFGGTSATTTLTVGQANTVTTTVVSSLNPSDQGANVTFTAVVNPAPPGTGTPTGTVYFSDGSTTLVDATLVGGKASVTISSLPLGSHSITAQYDGDTNFQPSASGTALGQDVNAAGTAFAFIGLGSEPSFTEYGQTVAFSAAVSGGSGSIPTGIVSFYDGTDLLGTATMDGNGNAVFNTAALLVGSHSISAQYSGDTIYGWTVSSLPIIQSVAQARTTTMLGCSSNPANWDSNIIVTATVAPAVPGAGTPTGTVTFQVQWASEEIQAGPVTLSNGIAWQNDWSSTSLGPYTVVAQYSGDANFSASSSANPLDMGVFNYLTANTVIVSLTCTPNPTVYGQPVAITATVVGGSSVPPTGTVTFFDGPNYVYGTGSAYLGAATLGSNGQAIFTTVAPLALGYHTITVLYSGDPNYQPGSNMPVTFLGTTGQHHH